MVNNLFQLDISNISNNYSNEDFIDNILLELEDILKKVFPNNPNKQYIKKTHNSLNFACPYCLDSAVDENKKRGWFLINGKFAGHYKCFNCGKYTSIENFFKSFHKDLDINSINYLSKFTKIDNKNNNSSLSTIDIFDKQELIQYAVKKEYIKEKLNLQEIENNSFAYKYLIGRCQYNFENYLYDPKNNFIVIMNLLNNDYIFGIQVRDLTGKRKSKYLTLNLEKIHSNICHDNIEIPNNAKDLSTIFNIFNINVYKPVFLTEGPFDAYLLNNCIALSGANKNIPFDFNFYYIYDNDKTGNIHMCEKIKEGKHVFLWSRFLDYLKYEIPLSFLIDEKSKDEIKKIKDITDVFKFLRKYQIKNKINWIRFFT